MSVRKIIYVTGTRADFGLMRQILKKLDHSEWLDLSLCLTGMHLSELYGNTQQEIKQEGFKICGEIPVDVTSMTPKTMAQSIGHVLIGLTELFAQEKPDLILLLGDRGETLAAALAAVHLNIHILHIHGGERSGTVDEMIRHSISKLSHFHGVATEGAKARLIGMGENPEHITVLGAPGVEEIHTHQPSHKSDFYQKYQLDPNKKTALLIYHPVVQSHEEMGVQFQEVMQAALSLGLQIICLAPNSDAGGSYIRAALKEYEGRNEVRIFNHLSRTQFIDTLMHVDLMLGNSSSGIIEAASAHLTAVNVGNRQNLRECGDNVIHTGTSETEIRAGILEALARGKKIYKNIYGSGMISEKCHELVCSLSLNSHILNKCNAY